MSHRLSYGIGRCTHHRRGQTDRHTCNIWLPKAKTAAARTLPLSTTGLVVTHLTAHQDLEMADPVSAPVMAEQLHHDVGRTTGSMLPLAPSTAPCPCQCRHLTSVILSKPSRDSVCQSIADTRVRDKQIRMCRRRRDGLRDSWSRVSLTNISVLKRENGTFCRHCPPLETVVVLM
eukprot:1283409-Rhodomonas_salina.3